MYLNYLTGTLFASNKENKDLSWLIMGRVYASKIIQISSDSSPLNSSGHYLKACTSNLKLKFSWNIVFNPHSNYTYF